VRAERTLSKNFGGSCQIPLAAFATIEDNAMRLRAMVATPDGKRIAHAEVNGDASSPEALGHEIARALEAQDASAILAACKVE
jgi:hydroxymethylbilane synthase